MSYPVTHPVEVGTFGRFKHGGKKLIETWIALEDILYDCGYVFSGNMYDVLSFAKNKGLLTTDEISMFEGAL